MPNPQENRRQPMTVTQNFNIMPSTVRYALT
jgi:hypothetical protein